MSRTPTIGVRPIQDYSYMSGVMADRLLGIIELGRAETGVIPRGVLWEAQKLFRIALDGVRGKTPTNPPATAHIRALIINHVSYEVWKEFSRFDQWLEKSFSLLERLENFVILAEEDIVLARILQQFFFSFHQRGEEAAYEAVMGGSVSESILFL